MLADMEHGWGTREYAESDAPWPMAGMTREEVVDWQLEWMHLSASRSDAVALTRMFFELDVRDVLGTIRVPTLVLSRGVGAMEEQARAFAALIPGARRQTMPGIQPTVMQEQPDAYTEAIEAFARELREEEAQLDSVLATVLFTDIVGSTARQSELGDRRWAELVEGDAHDTLARTEDVFDLVFLDAEKDDYETLFALVRPLLEPGGLVVADNVLSHVDTLGAYSTARQADPALSSVTVPLDRGLELSVVLA